MTDMVCEECGSEKVEGVLGCFAYVCEECGYHQGFSSCQFCGWNIPEEKEEQKLFFEKIVDSGLKWESRGMHLYIEDSERSRILVRDYKHFKRCSRFRSQKDNRVYWNIPFAHKEFSHR